MMATIAFVAIFSAILVFFVDELLAYVKKLTARPYALLLFSLLLASALVEMFETGCLWALVTVWIGFLLLIQWVAQHLFFHTGAELLAKLFVVVGGALCPIALASAIDLWHKKRSLIVSKSLKKPGYVSGLLVWVVLVLLLALGPPGSDFSG